MLIIKIEIKIISEKVKSKYNIRKDFFVKSADTFFIKKVNKLLKKWYVTSELNMIYVIT